VKYIVTNSEGAMQLDKDCLWNGEAATVFTSRKSAQQAISATRRRYARKDKFSIWVLDFTASRSRPE